jgi:hypothetical protein
MKLRLNYTKSSGGHTTVDLTFPEFQSGAEVLTQIVQQIQATAGITGTPSEYTLLNIRSGRYIVLDQALNNFAQEAVRITCFFHL